MRYKILPLLLLATILTVTCRVNAQVNTQDSLALVDLYNNTGGDKWVSHGNWLTTQPVSTWDGVTVTGARVTGLTLNNDSVKGALPASFVNLTKLESLSFGYNRLTGSFPTFINSLTSLTYINFASNQFSGEIPAFIGNLANLTLLDLSDNQFSGSIPATIVGLKQILGINLANNNLSGGLPMSIGSLKQINVLNLSNNKLNGPIPDTITNLTNLFLLALHNNQFSGSIPSTISNMVSLQALYLNNNNLSGTIPVGIGNITALTDLNLSNNKLSGGIPATFTNLTGLYTLVLSNNHLSGHVPGYLGSFSHLETINLSVNSFSGTIPSGLGSQAYLAELNLSYNQLSGPIPADIPARNDTSLNISHNKFTFAGLEHLVTHAPLGGGGYFNLHYSPQASIPVSNTAGSLAVSAGGTSANNTYTWYKNGTVVKTATGDSTYLSAGPGVYYATITNSIATALTLYSDTLVTGGTDSLIMPAKPATLAASYEYTDAEGWTHYYYNNNTPNNLADDTLLLSLKKNGQDIGTIGDGTFTVKLVATAGAGSGTGIKLTSPLITNASGYWVMNRYWQVTSTHEPAVSVGVRFYYNNQDLDDVNGSYPTHDLTSDKLIFYKAIGGNPDPTGNLAGATKIISIMPGITASDTTWTYHKLTDTMQYGEYSVASFSGGGGGGTGNNKSLPVTLLNFNGVRLKTDVKLTWQTAQEINADRYVIEHSVNGFAFTGVGSVRAAGNSSITQSYTYTDINKPASNTLYYRLKITDKDGSYSYSKTISISKDEGLSNALLVYPNPTHSSAMVRFTVSTAKKYTISLATADGKIVRCINIAATSGLNSIAVDVHTLPPANYIITIAGDKDIKTLKLVKE